MNVQHSFQGSRSFTLILGDAADTRGSDSASQLNQQGFVLIGLLMEKGILCNEADHSCPSVFMGSEGWLQNLIVAGVIVGIN